MAEISPETEAQLAGLTDAEWSALSAKVRAPDSSEAFRTAAARHISDEQLEALMRVANVSAFAGDDGEIDEAKVARHLSVMFPKTPGVQRQWGQQSVGPAPASRPGDGGRAAAAKRFGHPIDLENGIATSGVGRGAAGRAEAARRHGKKGTKE